MTQSIMSGGGGYTATPVVIVNEDGSESIDFGTANLESHDYKQAILEDFNNDPEQFLTEDAYGNVEHEFDFEGSEEISDDYEPEPQSEAIGQYWPSEDVSEMLTSNGFDTDSYAELTTWAAEYLPAEYVEAYDEVMDSGDWEEIQGAIEHLQNLYEEGYEPTDYWEESDYAEDYEQRLEVAYEMLEQAGQLQGGNDLGATALAYMAEVIRGQMDFEQAVGWVADEYGEEYTRAIFTEILNYWQID